MNIKELVLSGVLVVVGIIILKIGDSVNQAIYPGLSAALTQTVMGYVPTLFAVGILLAAVFFGIKGLSS